MRKFYLFAVEDHFQITEQGLVVMPGIPLLHYKGPNNINLLLIKPDKSELKACAEIYYSFPKPTPTNKMLTVLFPSLTKSEIPIGTEVWFVSDN